MKYLVIVESPAKITKISNYLNTIKEHNFIVDASYGHICEFKNGLKSIDINNNFKAEYKISPSKSKVVSKLKKLSKEVDEVIIATDQDREGEAIGYHLAYVLKLDIKKTKRICFNEISKDAIVQSFKNVGNINLNMYNAQQARSILDILIGYNISPLLWKAIQPKLSAGRCQSPALKLVYDREKEINDFKSNSSYETFSDFKLIIKNNTLDLHTKYFKDINNKETVKKKISSLIDEEYLLSKSKVKNISSAPPPPYITSSIQQDASLKFGMSPSSTMSCLQKLYEAGKITYMRTDSISISEDFITQCKKFIDKNYANQFTKRKYKSKVANAQEAHECIRPVSLDVTFDNIEDIYQKKLYDIIWKRTVASFMSNYKEENHEYRFTNNKKEYFFTNFKKIIELGFKKIYNSSIEDDKKIIQNIIVNKNIYKSIKIESIEKNSKPKNRYTEASLVKELENKGIGRPSTFSSIVNTIISRKYVFKEDKDNKIEVDLNKLTILPSESIKETTFKSKSPSNKGKLMITSLGIYVNEYMNTNFENINCYSFTSDINDQLDDISNGKIIWYELITKVYKSFIDKVYSLKNQDVKLDININEKKLLETEDTKYFYYRDKYGLCIIKEKDDKRTKIREDKLDLSNVSIQQLEELFKYPIFIGKHNEQEVFIKKGPYGLYSEIDNVKISLDKVDTTIDEILDKIKEKKNNIIKEWKSVKILNGPYGPYIKKGGKNVPLPKNITPSSLTLKDCEDLIKVYKKPVYKKNYKKKNS